ncbi:hypothetical protein P7K49_022415 [Saguinus oedipus]|uniref:Uncharacterized protein n=1 Tax=Saguinus oedipus TaxID=9490 RepID=A0ABQ9UVK2_SAGOE|nr:hypothetical protein P7K49_022415 [Saguinus oedipus]
MRQEDETVNKAADCVTVTQRMPLPASGLSSAAAPISTQVFVAQSPAQPVYSSPYSIANYNTWAVTDHFSIAML